TVLRLRHTDVRGVDVAILAALVCMGVIQAELGRTVERIRRRVNNTPHINMTSVWTFAGVLLLPPVLVAVLVGALYTHLAWRSWYRLRQVPIWRTIFNASLVILTCYVAHTVLVLGDVPTMADAVNAGWTGVRVVAIAAAVYFLIGAVVAI